MDILKNSGLIVLTILFALLFVLAVIPAEDYLLDTLVTTGPDIMLDAWREVFRYWATFGCLVALVAALLWYMLGQWGISLNSWRNAGKRMVWLSMLILPVGAAIAGWLLTPPAQEWAFLATVFYLVNNLAVYYVGTLCFSPSSFKYTPLGATTLRHW